MRRMDLALFEAPAEGTPRRPPQRRPREHDDQPPQRLINAPWAAAFVASVIVGGYAIQSQFQPQSVMMSFGFSSADLYEGHVLRLLTYIFLHGNWAHALMNAAFALAFGAPVARWFGERLASAALFFTYYLTCGILAAAAYALIHPGKQVLVVGASGAVSGLMGGAARVIAGQGDVGPILSRPVFAMGASWLILNLLFAVVGGALIPGSGGADVAWEVHLAGFVAGVLILTPFAWLGRRLP